MTKNIIILGLAVALLITGLTRHTKRIELMPCPDQQASDQSIALQAEANAKVYLTYAGLWETSCEKLTDSKESRWCLDNANRLREAAQINRDSTKPTGQVKPAEDYPVEKCTLGYHYHHGIQYNKVILHVGMNQTPTGYIDAISPLSGNCRKGIYQHCAGDEYEYRVR